MSGEHGTLISGGQIPAPERLGEASARESSARPSIFILSDVRLYREGLAWSLAQRSEVEVIAASAPSPEAIAQIVASAPTAVLLDFATSRALDIPKELTRLMPDVKVIAFAVDEVDHELIACAEAGICGFVTRDGSIDDVVKSILNTLRGEVMCSPRIAGLLFRRVAALSEAQRDPPDATVLTRREHEIAALVNQGLSNKEIARSLRIGLATVKNHVHNILEKLQVHRRGEAAARLRGEKPGNRSRASASPGAGGRAARSGTGPEPIGGPDHMA